MAAQEYFQSFQRPQQGPPYPSSSGPLQYASSPYQQSPQPQQRPYGTPPVQSPYVSSPKPWDPRQGYSYPPPAVYNQGRPPQRPNPAASQSTLMPPLVEHRSRSEPPENRRTSLEPPRRHHHHHHHHHHSDSRSHSRSRSRSRSRHSRPRSQSRHSRHSHSSRRSHSRSSGRSRTRSRARNDRDTFLGAGGGAIIGDTLIPGLGTLGGALLGALGGHGYAKRRSKSDVGGDERRKYKDGITVHSRWGADR